MPDKYQHPSLFTAYAIADHEAARQLVGRRETEGMISYRDLKSLTRRAFFYKGLYIHG